MSDSTDDMRPPITIAAAAKHLQCSPRTVRREIADGRLAVIRVRGLLRIDPADLRAYIAQSRTKERECQSASAAADIRSECASVMAAVSNALSRPALAVSTRKRSTLRSSAGKSTLRLAGNPPA